MNALILAHDLGTSGNKATLFTGDGELLASRTLPYPTDFRPGGIAEQNPKDYLNFRLTGRLATDPTDASGTNLYDLE